MRIRTLCAISALIAASARAEEKVIVYIDPGDFPRPVLYGARISAATILASAGVDVEWRKGGPDDALLKRQKAIAVRFASRTPASFMPAALAYTRLPEALHVTIFYERLKPAMAEPGFVAALTGHLVAHEIAHVLQNVERHSSSGVLKQKWDLQDYFEMRQRPLSFTPEDIGLIQAGLARRGEELRAGR